MTQQSFPFNTGPGASVNEAQWQLMGRLWLSTGVASGYLGALATFADSTGMQVKVPSGVAWVQGFYYQDDQQETLPIAPADPANARIDRVILRLDLVANTISLLVKQGVAGAAPQPPALTQTTGGTWEVSLAKVTVPAGAATIAAANVADERPFAVAPGIGSQQATFSYETQAANGGNAAIIITRINHLADFQALDFGGGVADDMALYRLPGADDLYIGRDSGAGLTPVIEFSPNGNVAIGATGKTERLHVAAAGIGTQLAVENTNAAGTVWGWSPGDNALGGANSLFLYHARTGSVAGIGGTQYESLLKFLNDGTARVMALTDPAGNMIFQFRNDESAADPGVGFLRTATVASPVLNSSGAGHVYIGWDVQTSTYFGGGGIISNGNIQAAGAAPVYIAGGGGALVPGMRGGTGNALVLSGTPLYLNLDAPGSDINAYGNVRVQPNYALFGHGGYQAVETGNANPLHVEVAVSTGNVAMAGNVATSIGITFARPYGAVPLVVGSAQSTANGIMTESCAVSTTSATKYYQNDTGNAQTFSNLSVGAIG